MVNMYIAEGKKAIIVGNSVDVTSQRLSVNSNLASLSLVAIVKCLKQMVHLTLPSADLNGRVSQLLINSHNELVGFSLDTEGNLSIIPGTNIKNALNPHENLNNLSTRLASFPPKNGISYSILIDLYSLFGLIWRQQVYMINLMSKMS